MAPRNLIFSIAMGADYSFDVKTIETHACPFFKVIIFSIGSVFWLVNREFMRIKSQGLSEVWMPWIQILNWLFCSGPEVSRFLQVSSIADLVLDVSKILAARIFAEIFLFSTLLGKVLLFKTHFLARFYNLWKMFLDFQIKQNTAIFKVSLWPQIKKTIFWPLTGLFFIFVWTKSYLNILWFFTKAPLFLQEFKQKKILIMKSKMNYLLWAYFNRFSPQQVNVIVINVFLL